VSEALERPRECHHFGNLEKECHHFGGENCEPADHANGAASDPWGGSTQDPWADVAASANGHEANGHDGLEDGRASFNGRQHSGGGGSSRDGNGVNGVNGSGAGGGRAREEDFPPEAISGGERVFSGELARVSALPRTEEERRPIEPRDGGLRYEEEWAEEEEAVKGRGNAPSDRDARTARTGARGSCTW
jgi:hypothetical protein